MYKLVGNIQSRTRRVAWMLEELGQDYEREGAGPGSDAARKYNPSGKIPALVADGAVLVDSIAIIQYLADRHGQFTFPAGTLERAEQDSFTQFCIDEVEGPLWTVSKSTYALPKAFRVPEIRKSAEFEFARAMKTLETRLGSRTYAMGDVFTVPDILFGHCAGWAAGAKFELPGGTVGAYFKRLRARPALQRVEERENSLT